ncbi:putative alkylated DNA repair protein AlkB [Helianthus anomalus]
MILLKRYISLKDQVDIVNMCDTLSRGPGGFCYPEGEDYKAEVAYMHLGRRRDPGTQPIPYKFISLAASALDDARAYLDDDELPLVCPDTCLVTSNTRYSPTHLHQVTSNFAHNKTHKTQPHIIKPNRKLRFGLGNHFLIFAICF